MVWVHSELGPQGARSISTQIGKVNFAPTRCHPSLRRYMYPECNIYVYKLICGFDAVRNRMKSVKNIQKITKAMKMVAASKLRAIQVRAENSRGLWQPFTALLGDAPSMFISIDDNFLFLKNCAPGWIHISQQSSFIYIYFYFLHR